MHDSRSGVGMFYRYQPRYLSAWIDHDPPREFETRYPKRTVQAHVQPATQTFRDPTIARGHYAGRGLLNFPIRLHDSVEQRLSKTTDGYGPNNLPGWYEVDGGLNRIRAPDFKPNEDDVIRQARRNEMLELGSRIKLRRFWYFMSFLAVVLLATRPYWPGWPVLGNFAGTVDDRTDAQLVEATIASFLPGFLGDWLHALFADLFTSLLVVGLIVMTSAMGLGHERAMTDISRNMWDSRFFEKLPNERSNKGLVPPTRWAADFFARSPELQAVLAWIKWRGMPWAIGPFMFAAVFYTAMAGLTQLALVWGESREGTCEIKGKASDALLKGGYFESGWIDIKSKCADLAVLVATDRPYHIAVDMADAQGRMETEKQQPAHWSDGSFDATPEGWVKDSWKDVASKYFRRVVSAPLMAPIAEYRPDKPELERDFSKLWRCTVGVPSYLAWPRLKPGDQPYRWTGSLTTPGTESDAFNARKIGPDWRPTDKEQAQGSLEVARLHVFLNDATLMDYFYANNRGKMRVCLWSEDVPEEDRVCGGVPVQEASEECRPCKPPARAGGKGTKP